MAFKARKKPSTVVEDAQYYADFYYVKNQIFNMVEQLTNARTEYLSKFINTKKDSKKSLGRWNTAIIRMYGFLKPKITRSGNENVKKCNSMVDEAINQRTQLEGTNCELVTDVIVQWCEDIGLTRIDIETEDPVEQLEEESF